MKILVSDFDDTFFNEDYLENINEVNKFVQEGNMFIIATGRNIKHLIQDIKDYKIEFSYLICNDGATIFDKNYNLIIRIDIDNKVVDSLLNDLKLDSNISRIIISDGFSFFTCKTDKNNAIMAKYDDEIMVKALVEKLKLKYKSLSIYTSHNWINFVQKGVSKGMAIKYIVRKYNFEGKNIYTVGDAENDISMVSLYNGYYMEDVSVSELKNVGACPIKSIKELISIIKNI